MKAVIKKIANLPALKTNRKLIFFLSDDWGSVRIKSLQDQKQLLDKGYQINSRFDTFDTLESNSDMEALFEVLTKHKDSAGNHPVITAVTNVGNPDFKRIKDNNFDSCFLIVSDSFIINFQISGFLSLSYNLIKTIKFL